MSGGGSCVPPSNQANQANKAPQDGAAAGGDGNFAIYIISLVAGVVVLMVVGAGIVTRRRSHQRYAIDARDSHLDLRCAPYGGYGVIYIDLVSFEYAGQ